MISPAQAQKGPLSQERIKPFQAIGKPFSFGKIRVQLVAMPRSLRRGILTTYRGKTSGVPRGERFYPFKLGFQVVAWDPYFRTGDLYRLMEFQLLFERRVRFLDGFGNLQAVKHNNYWENDHLQPLKDIIRRAEEIGLRTPLEAFM